MILYYDIGSSSSDSSSADAGDDSEIDMITTAVDTTTKADTKTVNIRLFRQFNCVELKAFKSTDRDQAAQTTILIPFLIQY